MKPGDIVEIGYTRWVCLVPALDMFLTIALVVLAAVVERREQRQ